MATFLASSILQNFVPRQKLPIREVPCATADLQDDERPAQISGWLSVV